MTRHPASKSRLGGDDAGFVLVEVLVSAALLVLVGLSVFTALNQSDRLAGQQVRRAMAANLAQAELERIRALPIEDVARLKGTQTLVPDASRPGDKYYLTSYSKWVTDGADEPDCATRSGGLDYMRITTMVAWGDHNRAKNWTDEQKKSLPKPVVLSSVVTPASRASSSTNGSLSVNIDRADAVTGVPGVTVTIVPKLGGPTYSDTTNINGCVVFPMVAAGEYTLSFNRTGWVNQNSVTDISDSVSVPAGATNKVGYLYDQAGTTQVRFRTQKAGIKIAGFDFLSETVPSYPKALSLYNPDQTGNPVVEVINGPSPGGSDEWNTRPPLFPSTTPYTLYAGTCADNRPPNGNLTNVNITAGQHQNAGTMMLPSWDVRVTDGTSALLEGNPIGNAQVVFGAGCGSRYADTTQSYGSLDPRTGRLADPGFPYTTTGSLCVSAVIGGTRYTYRQGGITPSYTPTIRKVIMRWTSQSGATVTTGGSGC